MVVLTTFKQRNCLRLFLRVSKNLFKKLAYFIDFQTLFKNKYQILRNHPLFCYTSNIFLIHLLVVMEIFIKLNFSDSKSHGLLKYYRQIHIYF